MIDDYWGDSSEIDLDLSDSSSDSSHQDGVSIARSLWIQVLVRKEVKTLSKKVTSLSSSNLKLKKEVEETKSEVERVLKEATTKLTGLVEENAWLKTSLKSSEDKLSETDEQLANTMERLNKAIDEVVIQTMGKLMHQYLYGVMDTWEPEKDIKI
ncbi:hypothetical protein LWI29_014855 [Acer saccharum]|uniref:Uncharacterized protein n=1 Tax=Acer saccharum TaxID=4024 RepID=A0AA39V120_ACESA|nr:hypothetical protein LWI29_014855 [Acer saccharum]